MKRLRNSKFFGLMNDESIDINSSCHVVVFSNFVEESLFVSVILDLFEVLGNLKNQNYFLRFTKKFKRIGFGF